MIHIELSKVGSAKYAEQIIKAIETSLVYLTAGQMQGKIIYDIDIDGGSQYNLVLIKEAEGFSENVKVIGDTFAFLHQLSQEDFIFTQSIKFIVTCE